MAKKHISITHPKVLEVYEEAAKEGRASRLIEEAILYYLDNTERGYITKEEVQGMIYDALRVVEIKNPNYSAEQLGNDIADILNF